MAQRDQVGRPLRARDPGDAGHRERVPLGQAVARRRDDDLPAKCVRLPVATAVRAVTALAETSTIRAAPSESTWVRRGAPRQSRQSGDAGGGVPAPPQVGRGRTWGHEPPCRPGRCSPGDIAWSSRCPVPGGQAGGPTTTSATGRSRLASCVPAEAVEAVRQRAVRDATEAASLRHPGSCRSTTWSSTTAHRGWSPSWPSEPSLDQLLRSRGPATPVGDRPDRAAGPGGAGGGGRRRSPAPRPHPGERPGRRRRPGPGDGLRRLDAGAGAAARPGRGGDRFGGLRRAGAGPRGLRRRHRVRSVVAGRDPLRRGGGPAAVPPRGTAGDAGGRGDRRTAAPAPGRGAARGHRRAADQGPGAPARVARTRAGCWTRVVRGVPVVPAPRRVPGHSAGPRTAGGPVGAAVRPAAVDAAAMPRADGPVPRTPAGAAVDASEAPRADGVDRFPGPRAGGLAPGEIAASAREAEHQSAGRGIPGPGPTAPISATPSSAEGGAGSERSGRRRAVRPEPAEPAGPGGGPGASREQAGAGRRAGRGRSRRSSAAGRERRRSRRDWGPVRRSRRRGGRRGGSRAARRRGGSRGAGVHPRSRPVP